MGVVPEPVFVEQGEALGTGHAVLAAEKVDRSRVRGADRERGLRPGRARGRPHADPSPPADQGRRHDDHHRGGASRQLLAHRPRRRPARLDRRGERRAGVDAFDPRGGDQLDRLPSRGPVPRAPARGPRELAGRALPERRLPDPDREGRTRVGPAGRHRRGDGDQLARRPGQDRARPPRADQRAASRERRDPRGSRDDLHRRGRPDRPRHRDPPDDVPVGRDPDREGAARSDRRRGSSTRRWPRAVRPVLGRELLADRGPGAGRPLRARASGDQARVRTRRSAPSSRSRRPRSARAGRCRT